MRRLRVGGFEGWLSRKWANIRCYAAFYLNFKFIKMQLSEIRITVDNWRTLDLSSETHWTGSIAWKNALDIQTDIHRFLDDTLAGLGNKDWAGQYATFLNKLGIEHQTKNGWWNEAAVNHENLKAFVKFIEDEKFEDEVRDAWKLYQQAKILGKVDETHSLAFDAIECFTQPKYYSLLSLSLA